MTVRPLSVWAGLALVIINALIWLSLGVLIAADLHPAIPDVLLLKTVLAFLSFGIAGTLLLLWAFLLRGSRLAYFGVFAALCATAAAVCFDDFGPADAAFLLINVAPLVLLVRDRAWYLHRRASPI